MSLTDGTQEIATQELNIAECMAFASQHAGKSYVSMVKEMFSLGRGFGKLSAEDYFYYRLYDDKRFDFAEKQRFLSEKRHTHVANKCNDVRWWAMADDKLIANIILQGYPLPDLQAVFSARPRNCGARVLHTAAELERFLTTDARYPLFAKPIYGVQSRGAWALRILRSRRRHARHPRWREAGGRGGRGHRRRARRRLPVPEQARPASRSRGHMPEIPCRPSASC